MGSAATSLVFPAPTSSYDEHTFRGNMLYIPNGSKTGTIPCLYFPHEGSSKLLLYFHGNAEDIGTISPLLKILGQSLKVHVIAVEYPGYGLYKGSPQPSQISQDAVDVFDYLKAHCNWRQDNIVIVGRSIGGGPASYVASRRSPGALVLISAFSSLRQLARDIVHWPLHFCVENCFDNAEALAQVRVPVLLLHGLKDELIKYTHPQTLMLAAKLTYCSLYLSKHMTHNTFDLNEDVVQPITDFFAFHNITTQTEDPTQSRLLLSEAVFSPST